MEKNYVDIAKVVLFNTDNKRTDEIDLQTLKDCKEFIENVNSLKKIDCKLKKKTTKGELANTTYTIAVDEKRQAEATAYATMYLASCKKAKFISILANGSEFSADLVLMQVKAFKKSGEIYDPDPDLGVAHKD